MKITVDKWELQLKKGIIELAVMLLVKDEPLYGYQITKILKEYPYIELSEGSVYPILRRLELNHWLDSYWDQPEHGPRRKYYQLTEEGGKVLKNRLQTFNHFVEFIKTREKGG